jgi:hypothetical protein
MRRGVVDRRLRSGALQEATRFSIRASRTWYSASVGAVQGGQGRIHHVLAVSAGIKRPQFRRLCSHTKPAIGEDAVRDSIQASKSPSLRIMPLQCDNRRYGHTPVSVL